MIWYDESVKITKEQLDNITPIYRSSAVDVVKGCDRDLNFFQAMMRNQSKLLAEEVTADCKRRGLTLNRNVYEK